MVERSVHLLIYPPPRLNKVENRPDSASKNLIPQSQQDLLQKKVFEEKRLFELMKRNAKAPLSMRNYDNLLTTLIHRNKNYFTEEYGKNEVDFQNYVRTTTNIYKTQKDIDWNCEMEKRLNVKEELKKTALQKSAMTRVVKKMKSYKKRPSSAVESKMSSWTKEISESFDHPPYELPHEFKLEPFIYRLSDPEMLKKGITIDPGKMVPIKIFVFETQLTNPDISWFHYFGKLYYPNNLLCAQTFPDDSGHLYNKRGFKSMSFMNGNLGKMLVVYSSNRRKIAGKYEPVPMAIFDLTGNGIVYDENGNKRLIYDQAEGILFDTPCKKPLKWKWGCYEKIIRRREELKYYNTDDLPDLVKDPYKISIPKEFKLQKYKGKGKKDEKVLLKNTPPKKTTRSSSKVESSKRSTVIPKESLKNKSTRITNDLNILKRPPAEKAGPALEKLVDTPALLKFSEGGCCIIEPLLSPCTDELRPKKKKSKKKVEEYVENEEEKREVRIGSKKLKAKPPKPARIIECFPALDTSPMVMKISYIKPIILKINDTVSLTIMSQQHIHIDFLSYPIHFVFNIGVTVTSDISHVYSSRSSAEHRDEIPCFFEILHAKCPKLFYINEKLKFMREKAQSMMSGWVRESPDHLRSSLLKERHSDHNWGFLRHGLLKHITRYNVHIVDSNRNL